MGNDEIEIFGKICEGCILDQMKKDKEKPYCITCEDSADYFIRNLKDKSKCYICSNCMMDKLNKVLDDGSRYDIDIIATGKRKDDDEIR